MIDISKDRNAILRNPKMVLRTEVTFNLDTVIVSNYFIQKC
jgi:hypothetical protein